MKIKLFIVGLFCFFASTAAFTQAKAKLVMKNGDMIDVHNIAQANCNGRIFYNGYILVKGNYNGMQSELKDFSNIKSIELIGFKEEPLKTGSNEKSTIKIEKLSGVIFTLDDAEIGIACYGSGEMYNQLRMQIVNPLTDKVDETLIPTKNIQRIIFVH